ncbi:MAG: choice-of-anchor B family protein, partial [Longimicrobiales bacterium]
EVECSDGEAAIWDCTEVDIVSFLPVEGLGGGRGVKVNDLWGWTDPETGTEWALVGRYDGTSFIDLSNPQNPRFVGDLPLHEGANPNAWRDIKVYQDHAYIVSDGAGEHGMQVFDLTQLRDVSGDPVVFEETAHYDRIQSAHNIVINEATGFAYSVGTSGGGDTCGGGLHMIDIRDPASPTFAGCFADTSTGRRGTGYSHDAQCIVYDGPDSEHEGKEICFGANETALSIADVTNKDETVAIATASYPNVGYSHQGWIDAEHEYFYMNDELDELGGGVSNTRTLVWDVKDLDDPILVKEHFSENRSSDHNLYIQDNLMYQSNYVSGLRILDISDRENPEEVAFFDTVPWGEDEPGFDGSWSNYPYFKSGIIVVTSGAEGVFVLRKANRNLIP